jgi:hypothetical protein
MPGSAADAEFAAEVPFQEFERFAGIINEADQL